MTQPHTPSTPRLFPIIAASSAGTLIEWYDFYIFASLSVVLSSQFFPESEGIVGFIKTLAIIWIGFVVRPFGALVFGRMGDLIGRKHTFLVTLIMMGGATFAIGLLPTYKQAGILSPILLLSLRILQGLALGGEYGGAATYVAEHCPDHRRGLYTSFIQTTATLSLFASLGVILFCRTVLFDKAEFESWGWRVPFWLSLVLVIFSFVLRMRLRESPLFARMKAEGRGSTQPLRESFTKWPNLKLVLLALFGATAGQGVVWYTGQFYALAFVQKTMLVEFTQSNIIIAAALLIATPFFVFWGWLSDLIGRKWIIIAGCVLAVATYLPIYHAMSRLGDPTLKQESPALPMPNARAYTDGSIAQFTADPTPKLAQIHLGRGPAIRLSLLIALQVFYVTMVYGPIAAFLVELFPTRIRYTSMSLPYHIGNGVFGGMVPFAATWIAAHYAGRSGGLVDAVGGAKFLGLIYPMTVALLTIVVGVVLVRERRNVSLGSSSP